jgi:hypothetical protein
MTEPQSARGAPVLLARWAAHLGRAQLLLAGLALVAMMLATVADVTMRYLFNNPVRGTYEHLRSTHDHGLASNLRDLCWVVRRG